MSVFPLMCSRYGLCQGENCTCPVGVDGVQYFTLDKYSNPEFRCRQIYNPQLPSKLDHYELINFGSLYYYSCWETSQAIPGLVDEGSCTRACSEDPLCKAAFFSFDMRCQNGYCHLTADVLSLGETPASSSHNYSSHIKVLIPSAPQYTSKSSISLR